MHCGLRHRKDSYLAFSLSPFFCLSSNNFEFVYMCSIICLINTEDPVLKASLKHPDLPAQNCHCHRTYLLTKTKRFALSDSFFYYVQLMKHWTLHLMMYYMLAKLNHIVRFFFLHVLNVARLNFITLILLTFNLDPSSGWTWF